MPFLSSCEFSWKIENIQKRCLRLEFDDYESDHEAKIKKKGTCIMEVKRLWNLATEIFKTTIDIRPNIFEVRNHNTNIYGDESLNISGSKIRNQEPSNAPSSNILIHSLDLNVNVALVGWLI